MVCVIELTFVQEIEIRIYTNKNRKMQLKLAIHKYKE